MKGEKTMHMRAIHPDMDTHVTCRTIDSAALEEAKESLRRIRAELTPSRDERHFDDVLYWLEKARDAVADIGADYWKRGGRDDAVVDILLDAECAVEDRIYEYRHAWELARGHEAEAYGEDNYNGLPGGPADR